jgi:quercetin dioxygenase-like cupin family protein
MSASFDHAAAAQHRPPMSADPHLAFDLPQEVEHLRQQAAWSSGPRAKTLVKYDDLRLVLIALKKGARLAGHRSDGRISIQAIQGHVRVNAEEETIDLPAGHLVTLERGVVHDVAAAADSAILITIAWRRS